MSVATLVPHRGRVVFPEVLKMFHEDLTKFKKRLNDKLRQKNSPLPMHQSSTNNASYSCDESAFTAVAAAKPVPVLVAAILVKV